MHAISMQFLTSIVLFHFLLQEFVLRQVCITKIELQLQRIGKASSYLKTQLHALNRFHLILKLFDNAFGPGLPNRAPPPLSSLSFVSCTRGVERSLRLLQISEGGGALLPRLVLTPGSIHDVHQVQQGPKTRAKPTFFRAQQARCAPFRTQ